IFLKAEGLTSPVQVKHDRRDEYLSSPRRTFSMPFCPNMFLYLISFQLPSGDLNRDEKKNKFVYLKVNFEGFHVEERVLMVTFHSGYIFIQTDKPVYNPGDTGETQRLWVVTAKFDHWPQNTFTSQFEVKKYGGLSYADDLHLCSRYLYGETVQGTAYVVFGVKMNKDMIRLPALDGGVVRLSMDELKQAYPNIRSLVGHSLYVKASVLTKTGSDLVEAEKTGIKIVESPYVVSFKDPPKYFKPGLPLDFTVLVNHHDGSPARNVEVKLSLLDEPLIVASGSARASINMPSDQLCISCVSQAETTQAGLRPEQQARQQMTVQPYAAFDRRQQNYLAISTGTLVFRLQVLSKGRIITAEQLDVSGQVLTTVGLLVTPDMMPSFRFVAFYSIPWARREEVVSDSVWIDVVDSCIGGLTVGPVDGIARDHTPGKAIRFQIRGDPGSKVSMVAVDNAVYLLKKQQIIQQLFIWDVVERGDMGCTRGGGRDASRVFSDAGVLYSSSRGFRTHTRQGISGDQTQRRCLLWNASAAQTKLLRRCCKDGLREIPMPYSCTRRSLYITEGWECIRAFRYCCATYRGQVFDTEEEEEEWEYLDETDVYLRSKFFESWLWTDFDLPTEAHPFFVDLKLPYSVARNEQVEIKAVIHNYGDEDLHVREPASSGSIAFKDRHTQEVTLPAGSSVAVPYTIVPLVVGKLPLEVMVRPGVSRSKLCPRNIHEHPRSVIVSSDDEVIFKGDGETTDSFLLSRSGSVLADSIDNSISEDSLGALIRMPGGCVEQNLASITLPLIATLYLERSKGWESVGVERKAEAIRYIRRGEKLDHFGGVVTVRSPSLPVRITAYVVKVFSMAHSIIGVSKKELFRTSAVCLQGGLQGDDPETTLTAFVLIALAEAKQAGFHLIRRTTDYLKKALLKPGRRPYTVAIVSYALSLTDSRRFNPTKILLAAAAEENTLFTLEATGYALLALVRMGQMEEAAAAFKWLNSQRRRGGGFGSTQSTMVVLQALSEYLIQQPPPQDLRLDVDVRIPGRSEIRYHFNPDTAYVALYRLICLLISTLLPCLCVISHQVVTYYNQLHEVDENQPCKDFELGVLSWTFILWSECAAVLLSLRALGPRDVRMVVLDISLPTGFTPENSDLEMLSNSVDRYISNFQIVDNLSDRGSLIIHLFKVSHKEPEILIFRLQQRFKVGLLQPSSVTVYEYYNPDHRCSRTYTPTEDKEELSQICRDNVCRCTQGNTCTSLLTDGRLDIDSFRTFLFTELQATAASPEQTTSISPTMKERRLPARASTMVKTGSHTRLHEGLTVKYRHENI
uniref:Complement component c3b, tandem duplicate 2 n=1 Tax=Salarias fasciatus TaxID=181472 RepID=A0A672FYF9_SALFA